MNNNSKKILRYKILKRKFRFFLIIICNVFSVSFTVLSLLILEPIITVFFNKNINTLSPFGTFFVRLLNISDSSSLHSTIISIILFMALLYLLKNSFQYLSNWLLAPVTASVVSEIRFDLFKKLSTVSFSFYKNKKKGDIISKAVNDIQEIEFAIFQPLLQFISEPLYVLLYLITLFFIDFKLTVITILILPVSVLIISFVSRRLRSMSRVMKSKLGDVIVVIEESIHGIKEIKTKNAEEYANTKFTDSINSFYNFQKRMYRIIDLASPLSEFLGVTIVMVILLTGALRVFSNDSNLTASLFISYIAIIIMIINPAKNIATAVSNFKRGLSTFDRLAEVFDEEDEENMKNSAISTIAFDKALTIKNLSFAYEEDLALKDINIKILKGNHIAVAGCSGAGKSTLIDLILRFYSPNSGNIFVDDVDVKNYDLDSYRSLFSVVSQDIVLFHDSIANNITLGDSGIDSQKLITAAKIANAYDFIMQLPDQFDTVIGDRGLTLSGGQRQRLSIARAVYKNAPVFILDEATSSVDSESERLIQEALNRILKTHTSIVIAHRLSTIKNADKILVLDRGSIIEEGNHEELLKKNGKYAQLVSINSFV